VVYDSIVKKESVEGIGLSLKVHQGAD